MVFSKYLTIIFATTIFSVSACAELEVIDSNLPHISYVHFQSLDPDKPLTVSGQLRVPAANEEEKIPAVVVVHGSGGIDSRGSFYIEALNDAGIATLEIDLWAPRGFLGGIGGRPKTVPETLPDAYGALQFLADDPRIDAERIGIMGFSWGGVMSMLTATTPYTLKYTEGTAKFAAHVAHYPVCWGYNRLPGYEFNSFTGSPVLIQSGELDDYDEPDSCLKLVQSLPESDQAYISVKMYRNATHAWDRLQPALTVFDPFAHLGKGGYVNMKPYSAKALRSRANALSFFKKVFRIYH